LDLTTLRWSWNKYVLMYFVDSLSCSEQQLSIILHCVLDPDLELTFDDKDTWSQWLAGLQLLTGTTATLTDASGAALPALSAADSNSVQLQPKAILQHDIVKAALNSCPHRTPALGLLASSRYVC
jgi:hypothetical protein